MNEKGAGSGQLMDAKLRAIFSDVFGVPTQGFCDDLSSDNVKTWDSLQHLTLILSLEQAFNVRFSTEEMDRLTSVRAIKGLLLSHEAAVQPLL